MKCFSDSVFRKSSEKRPYKVFEIHSLENPSSFLKGPRAQSDTHPFGDGKLWQAEFDFALLQSKYHQACLRERRYTEEKWLPNLCRGEVRSKSTHPQGSHFNPSSDISQDEPLATSNTYTPTYTLTSLIINS